MLRELERPETLLGVLSTGDADWRIIGRTTKPLIVLPPHVHAVRSAISRVLIPLDGTLEAAGAVEGAAKLFAGAGTELIALHVFDADTAPRHWDQTAHAHQVWCDEFLARFCALPGVRLELRAGMPGSQVVDVAAGEHVDLIILGWSQQLAPGRAATVRHTVEGASVAVLLLPLNQPEQGRSPLARPP